MGNKRRERGRDKLREIDPQKESERLKQNRNSIPPKLIIHLCLSVPSSSVSLMKSVRILWFFSNSACESAAEDHFSFFTATSSPVDRMRVGGSMGEEKRERDLGV